MDSTIKTNGLPKNYYRDRYYDFASRFNKVKIAYEQTMEKLKFKEIELAEYKRECDEHFTTIQLQAEYIKNLESELYKYEHQEEQNAED